MDKHELAKLMLEYAEVNAKLEEIGRKIADAVLEIGETVVVGDVRATFNQGRRVFNWERYAAEHGLTPKDDDMKVTIDWKKVCVDAGLSVDEAPVTKQDDPSVSIKVKK